MTIAEVNALSSAMFTQKVEWVFEHSPWVAGRTWRQAPFDDVHALHQAMTATMWAASEEEQVALLRAHPTWERRLV